MDAKFGFTRETATFFFSIVAHVERTISGTLCANVFLDIVENPTKTQFKTISDVQVCGRQYFIVEIVLRLTRNSLQFCGFQFYKKNP